MRKIFVGLILTLSVLSYTGCSDLNSSSLHDDESGAANAPAKFLYVSSGSCYAGGVAVSTGSSTVSQYDLATGEFIKLIVDYNGFSPGDMPASITNYSSTELIVSVENTGGRRIDTVKKDGSSISTFLTNAALNGIIRQLFMLPDQSFLVSKSTAIEKFSAAKARILSGANPYINAPGSTCSPAVTLLSGMTTLPNGKILYAHAAATPNNKISLISAGGYSIAADCLANQAGPTTTALPTSVIYHSSGRVLVAYGSTTLASNFIYSYDIDQTTNLISNITNAYTDASIIYGPSAMTEDPTTTDVFIANGNAAFNNIERFTFNPTSRTLTKVGVQPFIKSSVYTRCITSMQVGN